MTVVCHVDDIQMSHKAWFELNKFDQYLSTIYGGEIKEHRGKIQDYLEMDSYYSEIGVVKVLMEKYLQNLLYTFPQELRGTSATLEANHMFQVRGEDGAEFLEEDWADIFHHSVKKFMFMISRYRRYIHMVVSLLTTRSKRSDKDEWAKLKVLVYYLNGT